MAKNEQERGVDSVLVFGASGAVGAILLPQLEAHGDAIFAVSRTAPLQAEIDSLQARQRIRWLRADLFGASTQLPAAQIVYSLGPLDGFVQWLEHEVGERRNALPSRVIAFSSMSALSKRESADPAERALSQRLLEAENTLLRVARDNHIACTIFRPTLIYGAGRDRSLAPLARFARRWRVLPVPLDARGWRQPVHVADLAAACMQVRENTATFGRTYAMGGGDRLSLRELFKRVARVTPRRTIALPVSGFVLKLLARMLPGGAKYRPALRRLRSDLIADNAPAFRDFRFTPRAFVARDVLPSSSIQQIADA